MPTPLTLSDLVPGTRLGPYIISGQLAEGATAIIFRARNSDLEEDVVLKVLRPEYASDGNYVEALLRKARVISRLRHPNLVPIFVVSRHDELLYVCTAYIEGESLADYVEQKRWFDEEKARWFLRQAIAALETLHQAGVVHLDIKPASFLVDHADHILLTGFGLGEKIRQDMGGHQPREPFAPAYISPEQITGGATDQRSDIYSLGATLFHLMTGRAPFEGATPEEIIGAPLHQPFPTEAARAAYLSDGWIRLLERMMARSPEDRFADCRELRSALEDVGNFRERASVAPILTASAPPKSSPMLFASAPVATPREEKPLIYDEDVQFTVYRPKVIAPQKWYTLLAFAHLSEKPPDAPASDPNPREEVARQAKQILADQAADYREATQDSGQAIPRQGELTFLPEVEGIEFNPPRRTFLWEEPVHREEFRLRPRDAAHDPAKTLRGRMTVFLGAIIVADIPLTFRVDAAEIAKPAPDMEQSQARPYRKIFTSYSHQDTSIVEQITHYASVAGDEYLRDALHLRSGQEWNRELLRMIDQADVFQLFWSSNSMKSIYVKQEWEHALALGRSHFIRPIYWEDPFPNLPAQGLPPESLTRLHFQKIKALESEPVRKEGPSRMSLDQAQDLIGVRPGASRREIDEAFRWQSHDLETRIEHAPTFALKERYRRTQSELKAAWETLREAGDALNISDSVTAAAMPPPGTARPESRRPVAASSPGGAGGHYPMASAPRSGGGGSGSLLVWGIALVIVALIAFALIHFL